MEATISQAFVRLYFRIDEGPIRKFEDTVQLERDYRFSSESFSLREFSTPDSYVRFLGSRINCDNNGKPFREARVGDVVLLEIYKPTRAMVPYLLTTPALLRKAPAPEETTRVYYDALSGLAMCQVRDVS